MSSHRIILFITIIVFSSFILWAKNIYIDVVASAPGTIIPSEQVKVLQHLEGGIIDKINVIEGSNVKKGEILLEFREIASKSEVAEINGRLAFLETGLISYKSLLNKTTPIYPSHIINNYQEIVENFQNEYKSKINLINSEKKLLQARIKADEKEISFAKQKVSENQKTFQLLNQQIKISNNLKLKKLTSELTHMDLLKNMQILKTKVIEGKRKLEALKSKIKVYKKTIKVKQIKFNQTLTNQIKIYLEEKQKYTQRLKKYSDKLGRKNLISPINGMIKTMYFHTEGGVIKPGENILEIVPNDGKILVKSKLSISDIGFVKINQNVLVKLSGPHSSMFNPLTGKITSISPDSINDQFNAPFYQILIQLNDNKFSNKNQNFKIIPGLEVDCNIIITKRNLIDNILAPFKKAVKNSFKENIWLESSFNNKLLSHLIALLSFQI